MNRIARQHRIDNVLIRIGHDRWHRRFAISDEHPAWVTALAAG